MGFTKQQLQQKSKGELTKINKITYVILFCKHYRNWFRFFLEQPTDLKCTKYRISCK